MEDYSKSNKPVLHERVPINFDIDDEIRIYKPRKREPNKILMRACFRLFRFLVMIGAFFMIYYCLYQLYLKNALPEENVQASAPPAETIIEDTTTKKILTVPLLINEGSENINLDEFFFSDPISIPAGSDIRVLIVNSHSSEKVSKSLTVSDISRDLQAILKSRGIGAYFDDTSNDADGRLNSYSKMSEKVKQLKNKYNEVVIVLDIHNSDSGRPITFTVGCNENFAWSENLRLSCDIYKLMKNTDAVFRLLPTSLGQDNGILTVNIGVCGESATDEEARAILSSLADAIAALFENEPPD